MKLQRTSMASADSPRLLLILALSSQICSSVSREDLRLGSIRLKVLMTCRPISNHQWFLLQMDSLTWELGSSYQCPKCQKLIEDHYCQDFMPAFFDGVTPNSCPIPQDQSMNRISLEGNVESSCKKMSTERCVPVQSIAVRERRMKITEKTQQLGKLVPGGNKMNTAEMLQAAFKYIKYLQAQVGILQVMQDGKALLYGPVVIWCLMCRISIVLCCSVQGALVGTEKVPACALNILFAIQKGKKP
ncbi:hypothetical protein PTKIN_Ptkin12aG0112100 [Pterospermum kingtungense]